MTRDEAAAAEPARALVVFDKDGTLIDFHAMWSGWIVGLAGQLAAAAGRPVQAPLFDALGFDAEAGRAVPGGPLAIAPMSTLRVLAVEMLVAEGLSATAAEAAMGEAWYAPDPVALARPLADLPALFTTIRQRGARIAVATADDRAPTQATLEALGVAHLVAALACADDGLAAKPAPDKVLALCARLGVEPRRAVVVGDSVADLRMGRAAGAGLVVGVTSGTTPAPTLAPHADLVLPSVEGLAGVLVGRGTPGG